MSYKTKIFILLFSYFLLTSCGDEGVITFLDYPNNIDTKIDTIEVSYINWACSCANWIDKDYFITHPNYQEINYSDDCFFIEAKKGTLQIPEKYYQSGYHIRLIGSFYKDKGISRNYKKPTSQKPEYAKVFRYSKFEIIEIFDNDFISVNSDKITQKEIRYFAKDTVLTSGWRINNFLRNNKRKEKDLYIRISKDSFVNTFLAENVLEYRRYFIPTFLTETRNEILFDYGCATDCRAILSMSKKKNEQKVYYNIVEFNKKRNILTFITDNTYKKENEIFEIGIVDFNKEKATILKLNKMTSAVYKPSAIDTIIYKPNEIVIITNLRENINSNERTKKMSIIKL